MATGKSEQVGNASLVAAVTPAPLSRPYGAGAKSPGVYGIFGDHRSKGTAHLTVTKDSVAGSHTHNLGHGRLPVHGLGAVGSSAAYFDAASLTVRVPVSEWTYPYELTYFNVIGYWFDVEAPPLVGGDTFPSFPAIVSGRVTFWPGFINEAGLPDVFPTGFTTFVQNLDLGNGTGADIAVALPPMPARILSGQLETIDSKNAAGIHLVANSEVLNLAGQGYHQLVYNVQFSDVIYAEDTQVISNFAFIAPTDDTQICLTDPGISRLPYGGPSRPSSIYPI